MSKKIATYKQCENCGYNPGRSTVPGPDEGNKTCWKCGHRVYRDYGVDQNQPTMSEMKHTPGPWETATIPFEDSNQIDYVSAPDGNLICWMHDGCDNFRKEPENNANARLIAAAPEMAELLEDMASLSPKDQYDTYNHYFEQVKSLLSKIKNQTDEPTD